MTVHWLMQPTDQLHCDRFLLSIDWDAPPKAHQVQGSGHSDLPVGCLPTNSSRCRSLDLHASLPVVGQTVMGYSWTKIGSSSCCAHNPAMNSDDWKIAHPMQSMTNP